MKKRLMLLLAVMVLGIGLLLGAVICMDTEKPHVSFIDGEAPTGDSLTQGGTVTLRITEQPENVSCYEGDTAVFSVSTEGTVYYIRWQYLKKGAEKWVFCPEKSVGYNTDTLCIEAAAKRDGFQYRCVLRDIYNNEMVSAPAALSVMKVNETENAG